MAMRRPHCNAAVTVVHTGVRTCGVDQDRDVIVSAAGVRHRERGHGEAGAAVIGAGTTFAGKKLLSDIADDVAEKAAGLHRDSVASDP